MSTVFVDPFPQTRRGCRTPPAPYLSAAGRKMATVFAMPLASVPKLASPVRRVVTAGPKPPSRSV